MKTPLVALVAFVLVSSIGCGSAVEPEAVALAKSDVARASASPADANAAAAAIDAFGIDFYKRLAATDGNLVFSPASIALALSMARAGAVGQTATEMDTVLHGVGSDAMASAINALDQALAGRSGSFTDPGGQSHDVTLRIANAPFAQKDVTFLPAFLDALASRFGAGVRLVDYKNDTEAARQAINGWVSDQTEQRIPQLLAPGVLDASTILTLVNAIYLKAPWGAAFFDPKTTAPGTFTRADGSTVQVLMMSAHAGGSEASATFQYAAGSGWQALEIPYLGGSLAMDIVLPDDLATFEAGLDADQFGTIMAALAVREVILSMPSFDIETKADLATMLSALGMPTAFDPNKADFSGMTTEQQLFISHVIHQANISVDEKGTEAAAATAVVMTASAAPVQSLPPIVLNLDHPFLFALRDVPTGAILFLGRVTDPSIKSGPSSQAGAVHGRVCTCTANERRSCSAPNRSTA